MDTLNLRPDGGINPAAFTQFDSMNSQRSQRYHSHVPRETGHSKENQPIQCLASPAFLHLETVGMSRLRDRARAVAIRASCLARRERLGFPDGRTAYHP